MDKAISEFLAYVTKTAIKILHNNMNNIIKYSSINIIGTLFYALLKICFTINVTSF
jgi:hypothetical protein